MIQETVQEPKEIWTLEEIAKKYNFILLDTCAINISLVENRFDDQLAIRKLKKNLNFLSESPYTDQFYLTKNVFSEMIPKDEAIIYPNLDLSKFYSALSRKGKKVDLTQQNVTRNFREFMNFKRNFTFRLAERAHVIDLSNSGIYNLFLGAYSDFFADGLSETDKDLLIHGKLLSCLLPTVIITGEKGIVVSYYRLNKLDHFSFKDFGCFIRTGKNSFEERSPYV